MKAGVIGRRWLWKPGRFLSVVSRRAERERERERESFHLAGAYSEYRTTRRPDNHEDLRAIGPREDLLTIHRKETQTAVVRSCLPFIRSGQNHLSRHSERREEDKADRRRGGKTTSGNGQAWSSPSPRRQWRTGKNGEN